MFEESSGDIKKLTDRVGSLNTMLFESKKVVRKLYHEILVLERDNHRLKSKVLKVGCRGEDLGMIPYKRWPTVDRIESPVLLKSTLTRSLSGGVGDEG